MLISILLFCSKSVITKMWRRKWMLKSQLVLLNLLCVQSLHASYNIVRRFPFHLLCIFEKYWFWEIFVFRITWQQWMLPFSTIKTTKYIFTLFYFYYNGRESTIFLIRFDRSVWKNCQEQCCEFIRFHFKQMICLKYLRK